MEVEVAVQLRKIFFLESFSELAGTSRSTKNFIIQIWLLPTPKRFTSNRLLQLYLRMK